MIKCKKTVVRFLMILSLFPMIVMMLQIYFLYGDITYIRRHHTEIATQIEGRKWDMIKNIISENEVKARLNATCVKQRITYDLLREYSGNMIQLHNDLITKSDSPAFKIFSADINDVYINRDTENNRVFIANKDGILADKGFVSSTKASRDWNSEIKAKFNPDLTSKAVSMILTKNKETIYWMPDTVEKDTSTQISEPSLKALKQTYETYGLDELKKYDILVPVYITNDGDIFGNSDVDIHGLKVDNDKIIVIQEFSIYDAIALHKGDIDKYDAQLSEAVTAMDGLISYKMQCFALSMVVTFLCMLGMFAGTNAVIRWGGQDDINGSGNS